MVDINEKSLHVAKEVLAIIFQCIGAVLSILGVILIGWPFFMKDMTYWPSACVGIIPLVFGIILTTYKMYLDYKFKMIRLNFKDKYYKSRMEVKNETDK